MPAPTVTQQLVDEPNGPVDVTDTGTLHVAALADRGPVDRPLAVSSEAELTRRFGSRVNYSSLHDYARAYFAEGGRRLVVSRYVGPAAAPATLNLLDDDGQISLVVRAESPGAWGNTLAVSVTGTGSTRVLRVFQDTVEVEVSPALSTQADLAAWATDTSDLVQITVGAADELPVQVGQTLLTGGGDDRANAGDTQAAAALDRIPEEFGPGQVAMVDRTTTAAHTALAAHAAARNRFALLDVPYGTTAPGAVALAGAVTGTAGRRVSQLVAPWAIVDSATAGGRIPVQASAVLAGRMAAVDRAEGPHKPVAGPRAAVLSVVGVEREFTRAELDTLSDAHVTALAVRRGQLTFHDALTLADEQLDEEWVQAAGVRETMRVSALGGLILESYLHELIDGRRTSESAVERDLRAMLAEEYDRQALFGATPEDAYTVTVTSTVSSPTDAAIEADVALTTSLSTRRLTLRLLKRSA
jgi:hypothetical protein